MAKKPKVFRSQAQVLVGEYQKKKADKVRQSAQSRGYNSKWRTASKGFLRKYPMCRYCEMRGIVTAATLVDHFHPHRGDMDLFWARRWWVSSCKPCHDGPKAKIEAKGQVALDALAERLGIEKRGGGGGSKDHILNP